MKKSKLIEELEEANLVDKNLSISANKKPNSKSFIL
jgi:hypothetical protein